jgi:hypothetical protein
MKNNLFLTGIFAALIFGFSANAQSLSPTVICSGGGYSSAGGVSLSSTIGEPAHTTVQNGGIVLTQGQQQPYILLKILNLKAYLQGFYLGGGQMQAVLYNNDPMLPSNYCDSLNVELHASTSPFALVASKNAILLTNGTANVQFPSNLANGSYYIVLRHRNSIETWSKNPVTFGSSTVTYDFSTP